MPEKTQTSSDQTSSENGPRAPSIMRIYQIEIELVRGTTHPDQRVAPIVRTKRLEVKPDGSRSLRIRCERRGEDWMNVDFINVKRNVGQEVHHTFDVRTLLSDIF